MRSRRITSSSSASRAGVNPGTAWKDAKAESINPVRLTARCRSIRILITPSAKGGIAAGWAFYDIQHKGIAPKAFVFGVTNPVMVQGAVFAGITITEGWSADPYALIHTGDIVRVDLSGLDFLDRGAG